MSNITGPILGIETSCDDTAAAIVHEGKVLSSVVSSQEEHLPFQGVVPELASRAHARLIGPVVKAALEKASLGWNDLGGIAATHAPGLIGSLLVGLTYGKAAALARSLPFVGINHLEAHLLSVLLKDTVTPPVVGLLASGGHTEIVFASEWHRYEILGTTRDDAAGEAFDKVSVLLGLGYPGGPRIQKTAEEGNPHAVPFPRAWLAPDSLDFSFSGLKTAVRNEVKKRGEMSDQEKADIAASFQESVVEVLTEKTFRAAAAKGVETVILAGGVAANRPLRERFQAACDQRGWKLSVPELAYCGDNAAMVALAGAMRLAAGERSEWDLPAIPTLLATTFGSPSAP